MKLIGLLITILLPSLIFVWWMNMSLKQTQNAIQTTQNVEQTTGETPQVQQNSNPVDYSKEKVDEINQQTQDRANELDQIP